MANRKLGQIIKNKRELLKMKQPEIAAIFSIAPSTYQRREALGLFGQDELKTIAKTLKLDFNELVEIAENPAMEIGEGMEFIVEHLIRIECMQKTLLKVVAELLADKRTRNKEKGITTSSDQILQLLLTDVNQEATRLLNALK